MATATSWCRSVVTDRLCGLGRLLLILLPGLVVGWMASAQLPNRADVVPLEAGQSRSGADQVLLRFLSQTTSLRAHFEQEQATAGGRRMRFSGMLALRRPGQFRWEVKKPYGQLQLIRGQEFWLYDPDLAQLTIRRLDQALDGTPAGLLLSGGPEAARIVRERFVLTSQPRRDGLDWVLVTPAGGETSQSIEVGLNAAGQLAAFEMVDQLGRRSRIQLSGLEINPRLPDSLFDFSPPPGTQIARP